MADGNNPNIVFTEDKVKSNRDSVTVLDSEWLKNSFFISDKTFRGNKQDKYKEAMLKQRYHTSADYKFTSTGLGMNMAMNPKPQYTPYADIRSKGRLPVIRQSVSPSNMLGDYGMGAYYSEAIDDTAERIYLRFGVPQFNSLFSFASSSLDPWMATMMKKGRVPSEVEKLVVESLSLVLTVVGIIFLWTKVPTIFKVFLGVNGVLNFLNGQSRFYNFKPSMPGYWVFVDAIVNSLVNKRGLAPFVELAKGSEQMKSYLEDRTGSPQSFTAEAIGKLHETMPDFIGEEGRINIFSVVLRAQRIFNRIQELEQDYPNQYGDLSNSIDNEAAIIRDAHSDEITFGLTHKEFMEKYIAGGNPYTKAGASSSSGSQPANAAEPAFHVQNSKDPEQYISAEGASGANAQNNSEAVALGVTSNVNEDGSPVTGFKDTYDKVKSFFKAELTDGLGFVCLNVESTGSVSESFSSQTKQIPIHTTLQGFASGARDAIFSTAGGTTGVAEIDGAISGVVGVLTDTLSKVTGGLANPILAALGGINIEMPKMWDSSDARLPTATYRMRLMSPYGNAFSQIQNIYIPLAMLLAGALPRATGSQTHTSPYLCQVFNRGRMQTSLGIISSLSVSRGVSNLPFNKVGQAMAIDVDFTIEDLSSIMFMNVMQGSLLSILKDAATFSLSKSASLEDNAFSDYLMVLAGVDVYNQIYWIPRARLKLGELYMQLNRIKDPGYLSSMIFGLPIVNSIASIGQAFNQEDYKSFNLR